MRLFLAVFPGAAVQRAAHAAGEALRKPGDGVSWVKQENLHYTMRFLGDVGADGARRAAEAATAFHRCATCGKTERDDPLLDFRGCSECAHGEEYCPAHIRDHVHR